MTSACPRCGIAGKAVHAETVTAQSVQPLTSEDAKGWSFCATEDCTVVYYRDGRTIDLGDVRSTPYQKSSDPERFVCFCFAHSVAELLADVGVDGESAIRDEIKRRCKAGEDECRTRNPQGRCCLGNVGSVLKSLDDGDTDCCGTSRSTDSAVAEEVETETSQRTRGRVGFGAAVGLAALSSACCWVPALGFALGVSTAGVGAAFAPLRVPALVVAILLLAGTALYRVRAERRACATTGCAPSNPWLTPVIVLVGVLILGLYPVYASTDPVVDAEPVRAASVEVTYGVQGMTCGGCESHVEAALSEIEGVSSVDASFQQGNAVVRWIAEPDLAAVDTALGSLGYTRLEDTGTASTR